MNWSGEPATERQLGRLSELGYSAYCRLTKGEAAYLITILESAAKLPSETAERQGQLIGSSRPYALRLAVEHTRRALAEAEEEERARLQQSLPLAVTKRQQFWTDTCRDPTQMQEPSASVLDLYRRYGCRFVPPLQEELQEVLDALDTASPVWDRDAPELLYQTLELNFPELVRHV